MPMRMRIAFSYGITKQIINADVIISIFVPFLRDNSISKRLYADINFFFPTTTVDGVKICPTSIGDLFSGDRKMTAGQFGSQVYISKIRR